MGSLDWTLKLQDGKPRTHLVAREGVLKEWEVDCLVDEWFLSGMGLLPAESVCVC